MVCNKNQPASIVLPSWQLYKAGARNNSQDEVFAGERNLEILDRGDRVAGLRG